MSGQEIRDFASHFDDLSRAPIATDAVETLAEIWVDEARTVMGKDTYELHGSTKIESVTGSGSKADAVVIAGAGHAGWHNWGNRWTAPNRFWDAGLEEAERQAAGQVGARLATSIEALIVSGGVWRPVKQ